jgi:hypothetical protein
MENKHHVAWADRLGLNKIWHDAISYCRMSYGTDEYRQAVFGFYHLLVNIKDGPQLKKTVTDYKNGEWEQKIRVRLQEWRMSHFDLKDEPDVLQDEEEKIRDDFMGDLFDYMLQLLETTGFGFYKSDIIDEDYSDDASNDDIDNDG